MTATLIQPSPYPSRNPDGERLIDRVDPVIYPGQAGPLSADQLTQFERDGFIQLPTWLDAESTLDVISAAQHAQAKAAADPDHQVIFEPDNGRVRSIFAVHQQMGTFRALARHPKLAGIARQILGSEVYIHQSRINFKPGFEGRPFDWHSDFETWHMEDGMPRMRAISCVLFLDDNFVHNGPLMLIRGSHQRYISCKGVTPDNHYEKSLRKQEYGVPSHDALRSLCAEGEIVSATGTKGTVVFFDCNTMHGSSGNMTPYPRNNIFMVYNSVENALLAPFCGQKPRPEHIASRDFAGVSTY
ncbi:MAG: ectoine hydroxylase [Acidobacteria bacterium]|nr:ectoine hydroxylase [Acidobacteriota bacterium]MCB9397962.1 ectoine hydroxylase [Acidobacteriota bacterium]